MNMFDKFDFWLIGVVIGLVLMGIFAVGLNSEGNDLSNLHIEAIKHGAGHMVIIDSLSGGTKFKWNDEK